VGRHDNRIRGIEVTVDSVLNDILSEPSVIESTLSHGDKHLPPLVSQLREREFNRIYTFGAGSSNFAGLSGRYAIEAAAGIPTLALSSVDFQVYALPAAGTRCIALALSQSGETIETLLAARAAKERGVHLIALTNNGDSPLARLCDQTILLQAGHEEGPGTKTVVAQCVSIYQFALYLALALNPTRADRTMAALSELRTAPQAVRDMQSGQTQIQLEQLAEALAGEDVLYMVGAGPFSALAFQAANYVREVGKIHCCPFEATEFRHGPLEALSNGSKLLVLSNGQCKAKDQVKRASRAAIKAGAELVYAGDDLGASEIRPDTKILLPSLSELLAAQLYLSPIQLLGFMISKRKGLDPNHFDNIVKTWVS
jgi:glucosamine--fructose-6-phosphate aminotransferase (isomerizing)